MWTFRCGGRSFLCAAEFLLILLALLGCGGNGQTAELSRLEPAAPSPGDQQPALPAAGLPALDGPGIDLSVAVRSSLVADILTIPGSQTYRRSPEVILDLEAQRSRLHTATEPVCWAIYAAGYFTHDETLGSLTITLAPPLPARFFVAFSDYGNGQWLWYDIDAVAEDTALSIPSGPLLTDSKGRLKIMVAASRGEFMDVAQLALSLDVPAPPPASFSASEGTSFTAIELTWDDPAVTYDGLSYDGVQVHRLNQATGVWVQLAQVPASTISYTDHLAADNPPPLDEPVYYAVRTVVAGVPGPFTPSAAGWRSWPPFEFSASFCDYPDKVLLEWTELPFVDRYLIEIEEGDEYVELVSITSPSVTTFEHRWDWPPDKPCQMDTYYYYRVVPVAGDDALRVLPSECGCRRLYRPGLSTVTRGAYVDRILLHWINTTLPPAYYKIYRDGQDEGDLVAIVQGVDEWTDTEVDHYQHSYCLRACFREHASEFSGTGYGLKLAPGWESYPAAYTADGAQKCSVATIAGRPAAIYRTDKGPLHYTYATTANPTSADDWATILLDYPTYWPYELLEVDGKPAILYSGNHLSIALADTSTPEGSTDWHSHEVDERSWASGVSGMVHNGKILVAYGAFDGLRFACSSSLQPAASSDWQVHLIDSESEERITGVSMAAAGGKPLICYVVPRDSYLDDEVLWCARALIAEPAGTSDWDAHQIDAEGGLSTCRLSVLDGFPTVVYPKVMPYASYPSLFCARSSAGEPTETSVWSTHLIDRGYDLAILGMAVVDHSPCVWYTYVSYAAEGLHCPVLQAQAILPNPSQPYHWQIEAADSVAAPGMWPRGGPVTVEGSPQLLYTVDSSEMDGELRITHKVQ